MYNPWDEEEDDYPSGRRPRRGVHHDLHSDEEASRNRLKKALIRQDSLAQAGEKTANEWFYREERLPIVDWQEEKEKMRSHPIHARPDSIHPAHIPRYRGPVPEVRVEREEEVDRAIDDMERRQRRFSGRFARSNPASPERGEERVHRNDRDFLAPHRRDRSMRRDEDVLGDEEPPRRPRRPRASSDVRPASVYIPKPPTSASEVAASAVTGTGAQYPYHPLRAGEFRLLRLHPAKITTIRCSIETETLKHPPKYIAVSYAWGDAGDKKDIQIDGHAIRITTSLHQALEALRQKTGSVLIWADSICIDQTSASEKTSQVQLMSTIYARAESVAIYLGPSTDNADKAVEFLKEVAHTYPSPSETRDLLSSRYWKPHISATVSLFERPYWRRQWVVQEVLLAKTIHVYIGSLPPVHWDIFLLSSRSFSRHKQDIEHIFPAGIVSKTIYNISSTRQSYASILSTAGPRTFLDLESLIGVTGHGLHKAMRQCREKLAGDPRDKLYGLLGIVAQEVRTYLPADYNLSVRDVFTNIMDYILRTTDSLDVITECIYFPLHTSTVSANLPSWVPDWSHVPETAGLALSYTFSASGRSKAKYRFLDDRRSKLEIEAWYLDTVSVRGVAVGTLAGIQDFLMAFLNWRGVLLETEIMRSSSSSSRQDADIVRERRLGYLDAFARTICLNQVPERWRKRGQWFSVVCHVFASLLRERFAYIPLDRELADYADMDLGILPDERRGIVRGDCGARMSGRCFFVTEGGRVGMGSGFMAPGDLVVVPLGCSTPVLLRREGMEGEFRVVGDAFVEGVMEGSVLREWERGERETGGFVLR